MIKRPEDVFPQEIETENPTIIQRRQQALENLLDHRTGVGDRASVSVRPLVTREEHRAEHPYSR